MLKPGILLKRQRTSPLCPIWWSSTNGNLLPFNSALLFSCTKLDPPLTINNFVQNRPVSKNCTYLGFNDCFSTVYGLTPGLIRVLSEEYCFRKFEFVVRFQQCITIRLIYNSKKIAIDIHSVTYVRTCGSISYVSRRANHVHPEKSRCKITLQNMYGQDDL